MNEVLLRQSSQILNQRNQVVSVGVCIYRNRIGLTVFSVSIPAGRGGGTVVFEITKVRDDEVKPIG